jgi:hypothetical protein
MNLAVAGLMIPSTSTVKTGAFSSVCPGIPKTKGNRKRMERNIKTLYLFKILSPFINKIS